jgi:N-acetyl-gamma-glutamyl-phosphate reductase
MLKTAIFGASGYAGQELTRLLHNHPEAEIVMLGSRSLKGEYHSSSFNSMGNPFAYRFEESDIRTAADKADLVFLALPHGAAADMISIEILDSAKIIDLGADFRLRSLSDYREWYHLDHPGGSVHEEAVYGLCELYRDRIALARLVANPGCYTTCSILSLAPLLNSSLIEDREPIIIDAKSGVSGAGRASSRQFHYPECNESIKAYKIGAHRHTPEIEQELSLAAGKPVRVQFTPHLVPMNRGILITAYCRPLEGISAGDIEEAYRDFYRNEPFVRIFGPDEGLPETRWVKGSNRCDIGFHLDSRTGMLIIIGAIDNLVKGAAGQAVQNMNLLYNLPEAMGLTDYAVFP